MSDIEPRTDGVFIDKPTLAPDPYKPEPGLRIRHHVPQAGVYWPKESCVWCGRPTDVRAETPFRPELGSLPLMVTCGAHMRIVWRMVERGETPDAWELAAIGRLVALPVPKLALPEGEHRTRLLILSSHAILEYDDLRLFTDLGYDTFIPGAYSDPRTPPAEFGPEPFRPALPDAPYHPDLVALCDEQRAKHAGQSTDLGIIDWAKADLHPDLIDWADIIMVNCFPDTWIAGQWEAIRHKRVIWRTIGQSSPWLETEMRPLVEQGLEVVRYSPAERRAFEPIGAFAGETALIRFCKYPSDFLPWVGDLAVVGNVTQNMDIRGDHCGLDFWTEATKGLPTMPAGLGSERLPGGVGTLSYEAMLSYLSHLRCYLYMGTQPASYTLGLMEAMLAGVPVVSMGPESLWMPALFEGHQLVDVLSPNGVEMLIRRPWSDDPAEAQETLRLLLNDPEVARVYGWHVRQRAIDLFSPATIGPQWTAFLGAPVPAKEAVTA